MVDQNRITNWLLDHKSQTQPVYTQYDWPKSYLSGVFDFGVSINMSGIESEGRGLATNPALAIEKASAEAIERWICKALNISSVGVAVSGEKSARIHADFEAFERYYLNEHIRLNVPLHLITTDNINESQDLLNLLRQLEIQNEDTKVSFYRMNTLTDQFGVVCSIVNDNDTVYGFALTSNLVSALQKSFFEALPNYAAIKIPSLLKVDEIPWHLQDSFLNKLNPLLKTDFNTTKHQIFNQPKLAIEKIDIFQLPELVGCPIDPMRVHLQEFVND